MRTKSLLPGLFVALLFGEPAHAHTGQHLAFSFASGLTHPVGGLDHLLAMFAVGLLAAQLGGRATVLLPGAFVAAMLAGALSALAGIPIPGAELLIAMSVVAIALPVAFALGLPPLLATALVGVFAVFHGHAHGAELPVGGAAAPYMLGFALSTSLIHAAGVTFGLAASRIAAGQTIPALRVTGGAIALGGVVLMFA
jgi:urease accessory protein